MSTVDRKQWSIEEVKALGTVTSVEMAGAVVGIGRSLAYKLVKEERFPCPSSDRGNGSSSLSPGS